MPEEKKVGEFVQPQKLWQRPAHVLSHGAAPVC